MILHLVIASEFAAERTSCGPERHVASRACRIRNEKKKKNSMAPTSFLDSTKLLIMKKSGDWHKLKIQAKKVELIENRSQKSSVQK